MQESDNSLHAFWIKAKQNDSRYCISNDLLYERSRKVDNPGLLLPQKLRDEDLRERLKQYSELACEHASTLQVEMETHTDKNSRQRSLAAGQRVLVLLPDSNDSLFYNWKGQYTVLRKVNDTNYEIYLGN